MLHLLTSKFSVFSKGRENEVAMTISGEEEGEGGDKGGDGGKG